VVGIGASHARFPTRTGGVARGARGGWLGGRWMSVAADSIEHVFDDDATVDGLDDAGPGAVPAASVSGAASAQMTAGSWSWAQRHPRAASLEAAAPGPALVTSLAALEAADLDAETLLEGVAAWERIAAWAVARQAVLVAELHRRSAGATVGGVPDEIAVRLAVSGRSGQLLVERAVALDGAPAVADALGAGVLDVRKAETLLRETDHLSTATASAVQSGVLDRAPGLTVPQLRAAIRRAELTLDPRAAAARCAKARRERCVRLSPAPDAMAWVHAFLPAADALTVMTAVDAVAAGGSPHDERGVDARRADALGEICRRVLDAGTGPDGTPLPVRHGRRPHLAVTVNASTLAGLDRTPGVLVGYGPIPADVAREVARDADWRAVAADPATGEIAARSARTYRSSPTYRPRRDVVEAVVDRDATCTFPGCRVPSTRCDLDHLAPFDPGRPADEQTTTDNLHALCRHHHLLKTHGGWRPHRDLATGVTTWTSPTGRVYRRAPVQVDLGRDPPDVV